MENVEGSGGFQCRGDAPAHCPFTSCSACSIFNASQLTAAHTGSLVRNATHATTPAWQARALVVLLLSTGLPNTPRGRGLALTVPVAEFGVIGVTGVVSVFHREATCPLEPAGLFCYPWSPPHLALVPRANVAQSQSRGLSGGLQASFAVVYQQYRHRGNCVSGWVVVQFSRLVLIRWRLDNGTVVYC